MLKAKTKRNIARTIFVIMLFLAVGIVGGVECGACSLRESLYYLIPSIAVMTIAGAKGGLYRL